MTEQCEEKFSFNFSFNSYYEVGNGEFTGSDGKYYEYQTSYPMPAYDLTLNGEGAVFAVDYYAELKIGLPFSSVRMIE